MNANGLPKSYAFQYSNGIWDPFTLFIPNALGGNGPFPEDGELAKSLRPLGVSYQQIPQLGIQTYWEGVSNDLLCRSNHAFSTRSRVFYSR